jgi:hypothetical protein
MAKYLRISMGDSPENLIDIFPTQEVGRVSWEDPGDGGISVTAAPAGIVGTARRRSGIAGRTGLNLDGLAQVASSRLLQHAEDLRTRGREKMQAAEEAEAAEAAARNPERKREPEVERDVES